MIFSEDTFTDEEGTRLDYHVGELNATWERPFTVSWPNLNRINAQGMVYRTLENPDIGPYNTNGSEHFLDPIDMDTENYVVKAIFYNAGFFDIFEDPLAPFMISPVGPETPEGYLRTNSIIKLGARYDIALLNWIEVEYDQLNGLWTLRKRLEDVEIEAYTLFLPIPVESSASVELVCYLNTISLWIDGVQKLSFEDTEDPLYYQGTMFLRFDSTDDNFSDLSAYSTKGMHCDYFSVNNNFPFGAVPQEIVLTGNYVDPQKVSLAWTE